MPTDYADPEIYFPRLEAQISTIDGKVYLLTIWLREKPGKDRRQLMNAKLLEQFMTLTNSFKSMPKSMGPLRSRMI
jgi:hypothetical protein